MSFKSKNKKPRQINYPVLWERRASGWAGSFRNKHVRASEEELWWWACKSSSSRRTVMSPHKCPYIFSQWMSSFTYANISSVLAVWCVSGNCHSSMSDVWCLGEERDYRESVCKLRPVKFSFEIPVNHSIHFHFISCFFKADQSATDWLKTRIVSHSLLKHQKHRQPQKSWKCGSMKHWSVIFTAAQGHRCVTAMLATVHVTAVGYSRGLCEELMDHKSS